MKPAQLRRTLAEEVAAAMAQRDISRASRRQRQAHSSQPFGKSVAAITLQVDRDLALRPRLAEPLLQRRRV